MPEWSREAACAAVAEALGHDVDIKLWPAEVRCHIAHFICNIEGHFEDFRRGFCPRLQELPLDGIFWTKPSARPNRVTMAVRSQQTALKVSERQPEFEADLEKFNAKWRKSGILAPGEQLAMPKVQYVPETGTLPAHVMPHVTDPEIRRMLFEDLTDDQIEKLDTTVYGFENGSGAGVFKDEVRIALARLCASSTVRKGRKAMEDQIFGCLGKFEQKYREIHLRLKAEVKAYNESVKATAGSGSKKGKKCNPGLLHLPSLCWSWIAQLYRLRKLLSCQVHVIFCLRSLFFLEVFVLSKGLSRSFFPFPFFFLLSNF